MCPYRYYDTMRESKDPRQLRYRMVLSVDRVGIKATARSFRTSKNTVRKWHRRWRELGYRGLEELFGRGGDGSDNVVVIELKQWSDVRDCDIEDNVVTFVGGSDRMVPHPSLQVRGCHYYLADGS